MAWLVECYKFNENVRQYEYDGLMEFKTEEELMKFIKEVMVYGGLDYLWRITKTKDGE